MTDTRRLYALKLRRQILVGDLEFYAKLFDLAVEHGDVEGAVYAHERAALALNELAPVLLLLAA